MDRTISVLSVDDEGVLGELVSRSLRRREDMRYVGHSTAESMLSIVAGTLPDVVVLNLYSSGAPPREAMEDVVRRFPDIRFVLVFDAADPEQVAEVQDVQRHTAVAGAVRHDGITAGEALLRAIRSARETA